MHFVHKLKVILALVFISQLFCDKYDLEENMQKVIDESNKAVLDAQNKDMLFFQSNKIRYLGKETLVEKTKDCDMLPNFNDSDIIIYKKSTENCLNYSQENLGVSSRHDPRYQPYYDLYSQIKRNLFLVKSNLRAAWSITINLIQTKYFEGCQNITLKEEFHNQTFPELCKKISIEFSHKSFIFCFSLKGLPRFGSSILFNRFEVFYSDEKCEIDQVQVDFKTNPENSVYKLCGVRPHFVIYSINSWVNINLIKFSVKDFIVDGTYQLIRKNDFYTVQDE